MPDPRQHADRRNIVESILRFIPGFRGYLEKEYRRESDQLARNYLAEQLHLSKQALDDYSRELVEQGQLDDLPRLERVRGRLDQLMSTMRGDVRGYSGFFDYVRITQAVLDRIYDHDMALMSDVQALLSSLQQLRDKPSTARGVAVDLERRVDELQAKYQQRREILEGLAG